MSRKFNAMDWIVTILVALGGINWGLVGLFDYNLVEALFGDATAVIQLTYVLIGLAALYILYSAYKVSAPANVAYAGDDRHEHRR